MIQKLRILNLEDSQADSELIRATLEDEGIECGITRVETEKEFVAALDQACFDLLLIDYKLPSFDGMSALEFAKKKCPDIPFVFVSGSIGEDIAIEALKNGATDYVLKDKLSRLAPSVRRALKEAEARSERKKTEDLLSEKQKFIEIISEMTPDIVYLYNAKQQRHVYINKELSYLLGYSSEELRHSGANLILRNIHPEDYPKVMKHIETLAHTQSDAFYPLEYRIKGKDGNYLWFYVREQVYQRDQTQQPEILFGICQDITERKKAEETLRASQQLIEGIINAMPVRVFWKDKNLVYLGCNTAFARDAGFADAKDVIGKDDYQMGWRDQAELYRNDDRQVIESGVTKHLIEEPHTTPEGHTITLLTSKLPLCNSKGEISGVIGTYMDITEHKKLEEQLRHSQKMEAVGTLAGGIAHDFNNILNVIMGYGSMVMDRLEAGSSSKEQMNEVLLAAERAANLTKRLLVFSRKQVVDVKPININETIVSIQKMLDRIISENIDFTLKIANSPLIVLADAGQIEQVLMNLTTNARDAMPEGGRLTISTGLQEFDDESVAAYGYGKPGRYALITIADTGCGIDAETQEKIFEPFFTTKGIGEGTGLGLAISYGIIKQHDGYIRVYSELGKGTAFNIYLPLVEVPAESDDKTEGLVAARGGSETILVAEDDDALRRLTQTVLEVFGYTVITAEDGEDAIKTFMENRDKIHLVMLDMIMPKKSGKEAYEEIRKTSPGMKALFMSGYTMDIIKTGEITEAGLDFIHKPARPQDLLKKVREILDR